VIVGAATSSLHSEGAAPASDWGGWEAAGYRPPSGDGNGFATQYADDAALLSAHGLGALRITLEWARLEPRRRDELDADEVARYRSMLTAVRASGLQAWACLAHTSLPGWFSEDERGFLDEGMARRVWPAHVDRVAEAFGDLVDGWVTFHEPVRYALDAWLLANLPPGRRNGDDAQTGLRLLQAADAEAARLLRVPGGAPVASCQWLPPLFPLEATPECRGATASASSLLWDTWREVDDHDWIGVSCSYAVGVGADGSFHPWPSSAEPNPLGWAAWPDAIGHTLERVANERQGRPVLLLTGVWDTDDKRRMEMVREAALVVGEASVEQVHWWSAVDGYEGAAGFGLRSGLFDRDRNPTGIKELGLGDA
jgi:beta-glucosidase